MSLRREWYGGRAIDGHAVQVLVDFSMFVQHSIGKGNKGIKKDDILSGSTEGGLRTSLNSRRFLQSRASRLSRLAMKLSCLMSMLAMRTTVEFITALFKGSIESGGESLGIRDDGELGEFDAIVLDESDS